MNRLLCILIMTLVATVGFSQIETAKSTQSRAIQSRIHKMDMMIRILPLALDKTQINDLMGAIEKAHVQEKKTLEQEDADLEQIDALVAPALDKSIQKGVYPPADLQLKVANKMSSMGLRRSLVLAQMTETVNAYVQKGFNAGQIKVMAGSFDDRFIDPKVKKGELKDDTKVRFFIQYVLLDAATYELLGELYKVKVAGDDPIKNSGI